MRRYLTAAVAALALAAGARAHFVFVVPTADGAAVTAVFSEDTTPDEAVPISKIAGLTLAVRGPDGKDASGRWRPTATCTSTAGTPGRRTRTT